MPPLQSALPPSCPLLPASGEARLGARRLPRERALNESPIEDDCLRSRAALLGLGTGVSRRLRDTRSDELSLVAFLLAAGNGGGLLRPVVPRPCASLPLSNRVPKGETALAGAAERVVACSDGQGVCFPLSVSPRTRFVNTAGPLPSDIGLYKPPRAGPQVAAYPGCRPGRDVETPAWCTGRPFQEHAASGIMVRQHQPAAQQQSGGRAPVWLRRAEEGSNHAKFIQRRHGGRRRAGSIR